MHTTEMADTVEVVVEDAVEVMMTMEAYGTTTSQTEWQKTSEIPSWRRNFAGMLKKVIKMRMKWEFGKLNDKLDKVFVIGFW